MSAVRKMNNSQWKNIQPPAHEDPAILSYQQPTAILNISGHKQDIRETGVIEKLLHSYGFIQCCEREARLFFHFSEYSGDMNVVRVGDGVEFHMSYDKRTGRPIACSVVKTSGESVSYEVLSEERFTGSVVQEAKPGKNKNGCIPGGNDGMGRVTYENNGECFFLPYGSDDIVDSSIKIKSGDHVTFYIATDKRNGNIQARKLELVEPPVQKKYQGVVCSMKESFGFIERADAVKEIFFHYSEYKGDIGDLVLGDDVEFDIQNRNGKEVAVNISNLPMGMVIFEDISVDRHKGKILKTLRNSRRNSNPLGGKILFQSAKGPLEIPFGDKDQEGDYTFQPGDIVEFNIATDRRDKLQRATNIHICVETFKKTEEVREKGIISNLKEGFGFIQSVERENRVFFHFSELIDTTKERRTQEEVEFTVVPDPTTSDGRPMAIRIIYLPKGSVSFLLVHPEKYIGTIDKEPSNYKSPSKNKEDNGGNIIFDLEGKVSQILYNTKDLVDPKEAPRYGDKVEFMIAEIKRNNTRLAVKVKVVLRNVTGKSRGYIATLKENYGFIENADHDKEVFFHFSSFDGDPNELELGDEVEYSITKKSAKLSAENICRVPKGTIPADEVLFDRGTLQGKVLRPMRIVNPDQDEYCGLVQVGGDDEQDPETYPYGITSLADKRDFLQKGDAVKFQIAESRRTGSLYAVNIAALRKYIRAKVDSVKGQFGFINYEAEEGKKLFFHMTEVHDGVTVQVGDEVEFVVVQNQRNGKYSACSLRKITDRQRPDRLVSRLKSINDETYGPRLIILRQPKGPDNTAGFKQPRLPWQIA